jgi:hypothetical protein
MKRYLFPAALTISALISCARVSRTQVVIDSFDAGPFTLTPTGSSDSVTTTAPTTDIAGGTRIVQIDLENNLVLPHSTASLQLGDGYMDYNRNQGANFSLLYGGYASVAMNLDLSPYSKLVLDVLSAPGQFKLEIRLTDNSFSQHEFRTEPLQFGFGDGPGLYEFPIGFAGAIGGGTFEVDKFGAIRVLVFPYELNGGPHPGPYNEAGLYRFGSLVAVVPEPQTYGLISGIGLVVFATYRRNRRSTSAQKRV